MRKYSSLPLGLCFVVLTATSELAFAQSSDWTRALQPELELTSHLNDRLDIRFGITADRGAVESDRGPIFSLGEETMQFSALVDYSLHSNGLRMTGGALYDDQWLGDDGFGLPTLSAKDMRTYVGVGWDNDLGSNGRFGLSLDMGLTFEAMNETVNMDSDTPQGADDAILGSTFENFLYTPSFSAGVEVRF